MSRTRELERLVERELVEGLDRNRRHALVERLRGLGQPASAGAGRVQPRQTWDRAMAAFRVLEDAPVAKVELDQVERWLFEDLAEDGHLAPEPGLGRRRGRRWWTLGLASAASIAAAAAALAVVLVDDEGALVGAGSVDALVESGALQARGALTLPRPLAIDLVCGDPARSVGGGVDGLDRGACALDEVLGFALRMDWEPRPAAHGEPAARAWLPPADGPMHVSLFGVDARGELLYYAPTPKPAPAWILDAPADPRSGEPRWQATPIAVRLEVNHVPGPLRVFALASPEPPTLAELERWAEALAGAPAAGVDTLPWHLRLSDADFGARVCPERQRCASAETSLRLLPPDLR